jgi:hypothetical protein
MLRKVLLWIVGLTVLYGALAVIFVTRVEIDSDSIPAKTEFEVCLDNGGQVWNGTSSELRSECFEQLYGR